MTTVDLVKYLDYLASVSLNLLLMAIFFVEFITGIWANYSLVEKNSTNILGSPINLMIILVLPCVFILIGSVPLLIWTSGLFTGLFIGYFGGIAEANP